MTIDWLITRPFGVVIVLVDTTTGAGTHHGITHGTTPGMVPGIMVIMVAIGMTLGTTAGMILGTIPGTTDMVGAGATLAGVVAMYRPTVTQEPSDVRIQTDM